MTTARTVPVTTEMGGDELELDDAWKVVRTHGVMQIAVQSFLRFRYGDGFTNSRALAFQISLSVVPFVLALAGLAAEIDIEKLGRVVVGTIAALTPGGGAQDALAIAVDGEAEEAAEIALGLGLAFAAVSMTTAMAQVERGTNRIYGIRRDRPALHKYARAGVLTVILSVPAGTSFLMLVVGGSFAEAMVDNYGWSQTTVTIWNIARWPAGFALMTLTIAVLLDHAPRRRQPALSWLALGAGVAVTLTMVSTGLLAIYVNASESFGDVYGPLVGIMALLLWSYLSSIALFLGTSLAAQLECLRAGVHEAAYADPGPPAAQAVSERT